MVGDIVPSVIADTDVFERHGSVQNELHGNKAPGRGYSRYFGGYRGLTEFRKIKGYNLTMLVISTVITWGE